MCMFSTLFAYFHYLGNAVNASDGTQLEEKRGQFLGSTLKSTGNTFLVII